MAGSNDMPKVNFDEKNKNIEFAKTYAKYIEAKNVMRASYAKRFERRKRVIFGLLTSAVLGIYALTIANLGQETFFDDFEEPPREIKN